MLTHWTRLPTIQLKKAESGDETSSQAEKDTFQLRLKNVCELLTPPGGITIANTNLMNAMFDAVEETQVPDDNVVDAGPVEKSTRSFLCNNGIFEI